MHSVSLGLIDLIMVMMKLTKVLLFEKIMGFYTKIIFDTVVFSCFKLVTFVFYQQEKKRKQQRTTLGIEQRFIALHFLIAVVFCLYHITYH